ncbi:MAG TPA: hypothetical protein VF451_03650 [Acidobacteriota bacterium]
MKKNRLLSNTAGGERLRRTAESILNIILAAVAGFANGLARDDLTFVVVKKE